MDITTNAITFNGLIFCVFPITTKYGHNAAFCIARRMPAHMMEPTQKAIGTMSDKETLLKAHASMLAVLDVKFQNSQEWQAFKAINELLLSALATAESKPAPLRKLPKPRPQSDSGLTYSVLAAKALESNGEPVTTTKMVEFVGQHKKLTTDPAKAKINVVSALSHDSKFKSIEWQGGRAWWWADKPTPWPKTTTSSAGDIFARQN